MEGDNTADMEGDNTALQDTETWNTEHLTKQGMNKNLKPEVLPWGDPQVVY